MSDEIHAEIKTVTDLFISCDIRVDAVVRAMRNAKYAQHLIAQAVEQSKSQLMEDYPGAAAQLGLGHPEPAGALTVVTGSSYPTSVLSAEGVVMPGNAEPGNGNGSAARPPDPSGKHLCRMCWEQRHFVKELWPTHTAVGVHLARIHDRVMTAAEYEQHYQVELA